VKKIAFTDQARADVRCLDIPTAMRIFAALHRFAETGVGDVKRLQGDTEECRLRVCDYRVRFVEEADGIQIRRVLHRSQANR
jgi:mRNA-degrading endonuclease RelE of RelBE toxin-antitoxin system